MSLKLEAHITRGKALLRVSILTVLCSGVIALAALLGLAGTAQAAVIPGAVTSVTVTPANPSQYDPIHVAVAWSVPDSAQAGDTFSLTLPSQLIALTTGFNVTNSAGQVVATAQVSGGIVTFTLTDFKTTHTAVQGTAYFDTNFAQVVTPGQPITLNFGTAATLTITPGGFVPVDRADSQKVGNWVDSQGNISITPTNRIHWIVESPQGPFNQASITDQVGAGQQNDCTSVTASVSTGFDAQGQILAWTPLPASSYNITSCTATSLSATIAPVPSGQVVSIAYDVVVTDPSLSSYSNSADVTVDGLSLPVTNTVQRYAAGGEGDGSATPTPSTPVSTPTPSTSTPSTPTPSASTSSTSTSSTPMPSASTSSAQASSTTSTAGSGPIITASSNAPGSGELASTGAGSTLVVGLVGLAAIVIGGTLLILRRRKHTH
ncbi:LPXTG-motif cell wall-anchored protein [Psychromicrobium silvestre]|uniref:LPXTG-motif cell wall-anchored protein n=1 Tax=Psychromicrobium silvestre TaxID=1645614 RepID=A0A7Y9S829_9MICC|nr:Ig-like domain-containing protein [Psychromicrobium silvestre]NYE96513.1 LPXTG-motif cell wall-anchored protein [Psychromicrobium silvestre]